MFMMCFIIPTSHQQRSVNVRGTSSLFFDSKTKRQEVSVCFNTKRVG